MAFPAEAKSRVPGNFIPLFAEKRLDFRPNPAKIHGKSGIQFQICHEFALSSYCTLISRELALHLLHFFP